MTVLCNTSDIAPDSAIGIDIEQDRYIVVNKDNQFFVYLNLCPHLKIALEWQPNQFLDYEKNFIQCSTHAALFSIESGLCIKGPCRGQSLTSVCFTVKEGVLTI